MKLGVAKSSVSLWVRDVVIVGARPPRVRGAGGPNALARRRVAEVDRLLADGRERIGRLTDQEFLVAGAALYAGEGSKRDGDLIFTNIVTLIAEFVAIRVGLSYFHLGPVVAAALGIVLVIFTLSGGRYWRWERIVLGMAIFNGLFLVASIGAAARASLPPAEG